MEALILFIQALILVVLTFIFRALERIERKLPDRKTLARASVQSKEFWNLLGKTFESIQQKQREIEERGDQLRQEMKKGARKGKIVELDTKEEV